jgi:GNAT superfamily N-acetyltransferase
VPLEPYQSLSSFGPRNRGARTDAARSALIGQSVGVTTGPTVDVREVTPEDDEAVVALMTAYLTWAHAILRERYGVDEPPTDPSLVRDSLAALRRPLATILIAEQRGHAIGVGAVRGLTGDVAEIKRMYVDPAVRGLRVGAALLDRLLSEARRSGARVARLDTAGFMTEAQRLYQSRGFTERSPYEGSEIPERLQSFWLFFERSLP